MITDQRPPQSSEERLALLLRLSETFNSSLDLDEVLNWVMDEVIAAVRAERGFVMLRDEAGHLRARIARGMDQRAIEAPEFQISRSTVEKVALEGMPILTSDAQADSRFSMRQSVMFLGLRAMLCVPLKVKEKVSGVIYVDNRLQAGIFSQADADLLAAIASSAAIAIENARLYAVAVEKGRMEQELRLARQMQSNLLPQSTPQLAGWEFAARWLPAREVAGDYYDFVMRDDGSLGLLIADVTDKGMPAALFMAFSRSIVRASVDRAHTPIEGITHANHLICAESTGGFFVTLFYAQINPATGILAYVNAGHNPPLSYRIGQDQLTKITRTGIPLGIESETIFEQRQITLAPGDFLLLYTDGVPDATDADDQPFGMERLQALLLAHRRESADSIMTALEQALHDFTGHTAPFDDITIVLVKRAG
jgi:sigma-B regulation protein RsbU (phosphoserine phosphatase)